MRALMSLFLALAPTGAWATALPSLKCVFTEPFLTVHTWSGGMAVDSANEGYRRATKPLLSGTQTEPVIKSSLGTLTITNTSGGDGMSEYEFALTGIWQGRQNGGCVRFPDGATPRPIIGLAANNSLNVRASGTTSAPIIGTIGGNGYFWAFPEPIVQGWVHGAFLVYPPTDAGKITVLQGWVRARYLGAAGAK